MATSSIESIVIEYEADGLTTTIIPMFAELVEHGFLHLHDVVFISRNQDGQIQVAELSDMDPKVSAAFEPIMDEIAGLISSEDVEQVAAELKAGRSALIVLVEHVWVDTLREVVEDARGRVIVHERISDERVHEAIRLADQD